MPDNQTQKATAKQNGQSKDLDALIIGAGFAGMYALHSLREQGLSAKVYDAAGGVGGTWWWNRYPGARVDFPGGPFYCYTFSEELVQEYDWTETQPDQASVLAYLEHVADKFNLRPDIQLNTRVSGAEYDEASKRWKIETGEGASVSARFLICAVGVLSATNKPDIPGLDIFAGECYHTGQWPHGQVDFAGKRVGIIGTGSSGIQAIPVIAKEAEHLTVFQRTPQYSIPAGNQAIDADVVQKARDNWPTIRTYMMNSSLGAPFPGAQISSEEHTADQRQALYQRLWDKGGLGLLFESYTDILTNKETSNELGAFVRSKIGEAVHDPAVAEKLMPDYYFGTKRLIMDEGYFETYNRDNVTLVDLRQDPIDTMTPDGIRAGNEEHPIDILVLATGYDAITGAMERINPRGRGGVTLKEKWADRPGTYLGMTVPDFPNLFMIHGPESPAVLFNMPLGAELQSDWIRDCVTYMDEQGFAAIEPTSDAVAVSWGQEVDAIASHTLFPETDSWYTGANIPGKNRQFAVYLGGPEFYERLAKVAEEGYTGFDLKQ